MVAEELYRSRMARLWRIVILRSVEEILLDGLLFFSLFCIAIRIIETTVLPSLKDFSPYALSLALALLLSLFWRRRRAKSFEEELVAIDLRLDLKERLSTAYEYHARPPACLLDQLLKQEAVDLLADLRKRRILAPLLSRRHLLLPAAVVLLVVLHVVDIKPILWKKQNTGPEALDKIGVKIGRYVRQQKQSASKDRETEDAARMLQILAETAEKINQRSAEPDRILQDLQRLTAEVQEEQTRILERLQSQLNPQEASDMPREAAPIPEGKETQTQAAAEQLLKKIRDKYGDQVPGSISKNLESLDTNRRLQNFLDQTANEFRNFTGRPGSPDGKSKINKGLAINSNDEKQNPEKEKQKKGNKPYEVVGSTSSGSRTVEPQPAGQGTGESEGRVKPDKYGEDQAAAAGRGKGSDEKKESYTLPTAKGPAFKDQGVPMSADYVNTHVRSLTRIGKTTLTEEQLLRSYQQEIEEALQKEDIPIVYRNYIKNYFLNIGLRKDEKEDDANQ